MHNMSISCSAADAVSSNIWPVLFIVLTLSVAKCKSRVHIYICTYIHIYERERGEEEMNKNHKTNK